MGRHGRSPVQDASTFGADRLGWAFGGCTDRGGGFGIVGAVTFAVSTPTFEGPIDLLLHLVSSHEVDVLDIPLLPIVDGFVHVLTEQRDQIDFNQLSEFLLVAAILIELKSQKLLPGRESADDDDELIGWEERDLLLARLLECRAYAAAADVFVAMTEEAARSVPREVGLPDDFAVHAPDLLAGVTPEELAQAYLRGRPSAPYPGSICPT